MNRIQELDELIVQTKRSIYEHCVGKPAELIILIDKLERYAIERHECEAMLK